MEYDVNEYFNLPDLLKNEELGIRRAFAAEPYLSAKEYFGRLDRFLELAPAVESALEKLASLDFDRDNYKILEDMLALLTRMRWDRYIRDFHGLFEDFGKKGNGRAVAANAQRIASDFKRLHSLVKSAKGVRK